MCLPGQPIAHPLLLRYGAIGQMFDRIVEHLKDWMLRKDANWNDEKGWNQIQQISYPRLYFLFSIATVYNNKVYSSSASKHVALCLFNHLKTVKTATTDRVLLNVCCDVMISITWHVLQ